MPALLDGRWPRAARLPTLSDHPHNLFTLLGSSHRLHVAEPVTRLCPPALCGGRREGGVVTRPAVAGLRLARSSSLHLLLPRDLHEGLPSISDRWQGFGEVDPLGDGPAPAPRAERQRPRSGFAERFAASELARALSPCALPRRHPARSAPGDGRRCTSCTRCSRTRPGSTCRPAASSRTPRRAWGRAPAAGPRDPLGPLLHFQRHLLQVALHRPPARAAARPPAPAARLFDRSLGRRGRRPRHQLPRGAALARRRAGHRARRRAGPALRQGAPASGRGASSTRRSARSTSSRRSPRAARPAAVAGRRAAGRRRHSATARSCCGAPGPTLARDARLGADPPRGGAAPPGRDLRPRRRPAGGLRPRAPSRADRAPGRRPRAAALVHAAPTSTRPRCSRTSRSEPASCPTPHHGRPQRTVQRVAASTSPWPSTGGSPR